MACRSVTEDVDGALVVDEPELQLKCRLNASAALVWKACDGSRTPSDLAGGLARELGPHADEDLVLIALDDLTEHGLIASGYARRKSSAMRQSRRRLLRRVGLAGATAITLPIVYGMAPPALAGSVDAHAAQPDF
jgi:Coenzyme PQQ synthesis protein D (PqqD)